MLVVLLSWVSFWIDLESVPARISLGNIGNPVENTMLELAEAVIKVTGSKSKIVHLPLPKDDPKKRCPDITRARTLLGWEPNVPLAEGLKSTMDWYQQKMVSG